jgi:two-component system, NtrC family, response regulator HydG
MDARVLIAVADAALRAEVATHLSGFLPQLASDKPADVLARVGRQSSLSLLILGEPDTGCAAALNLIEAVKDRRPDLAVLLLSTHPTLESAALAIRRGAEDVLPFPCAAEVLRKGVERILEAADLRARLQALQHLAPRGGTSQPLISRSACMRRVFERAEAAARSDTPILITGETGTGKELVARSIHANSRRAERPFVPINCSALPHDLLESELFGHRRGAFSGAHVDSAGLFVAAHCGTLFLDEIGELPVEAQPKLLRVLQDGEIRPVGGIDSRNVDVRIIAATNRTVAALSQGLMRQDLFFRLSVLVIELPPLRERLDDLPLLVHAFIERLRARGVAVESMDAQALTLVADYPFPGNVRELENLVEGTAVMLAAGRTSIGVDDVRVWLGRRDVAQPAAGNGHELPLRLEDLEAWAIGEAMRRTHGNKRRAAQLLGISRDTLYRKLEEIPDDSDMSECRTLPLTR